MKHQRLGQQLSSFFSKASEFALDLVFPRICLGCRAEIKIICDRCLENIRRLSIQFCPVCERAATENGYVCSYCKSTGSAFAQLIVSADYKDKLLAKAIHTYKYKFVSELSEPLGIVMTETLKKNLRGAIDFIVPVPLHPRRLRWRGFNQSDLLANHISQNLLPGIEIPIANEVIYRNKYTQPQMKIKNYRQREENIRSSFFLGKNLSSNIFKRKNILLVDDVCTTGSTIFECAKTLSALHPRSISAIVLARQS